MSKSQKTNRAKCVIMDYGIHKLLGLPERMKIKEIEVVEHPVNRSLEIVIESRDHEFEVRNDGGVPEVTLMYRTVRVAELDHLQDRMRPIGVAAPSVEGGSNEG